MSTHLETLMVSYGVFSTLKFEPHNLKSKLKRMSTAGMLSSQHYGYRITRWGNPYWEPVGDWLNGITGKLVVVELPLEVPSVEVD